MRSKNLFQRVSMAAGLAAIAACGSSGGSENGTGGAATTSSSRSATSSATSAESSATSTGSSSSTGGGACMVDMDCKDPNHPVCDQTTGACVGCSPKNDTCPMGQFCDATSNTCAVGCTDNTDCVPPTICDTKKNQCVGCNADADCMPGTVCMNQVCIAGCNPNHDCPMGLSCCSNQCADTSNNVDNCGMCGMACPQVDNAAISCKMSVCAFTCLPAFADCDVDAMNGCEHNKLLDGDCVCVPGTQQPCYNGPPNTMGVGPCKAGTQTCDPSGTSWGACTGEVVPQFEICNNNVDDDCDGTKDNVPDLDGDGWTICNGDCCDSVAQGCPDPAHVNPGALEVLGDGVDNDCDPITSDIVGPVGCSPAQKLTNVTATDVANAMDICQSTTLNPPMNMKKWGIVQAAFLMADGSMPSAAALTNFRNSQAAVLTAYGTGGVTPHHGATFAGISSGIMRDENDAGYANPNFGTDFSTMVNPPPVYLAAHGGNLPSSQGCSGNCPAGSGAYDSIDVHLQIRVPTNVQSLSYDFRYFTAEYWQYSCTVFNDFYLALLTSGAPGIPADHNISFDALNNPVSVNNGFFQVCAKKGCYTCPSGTGNLAGTGMELPDPIIGGTTGGGTTWLTTDAPVVPGEVITLDFMVFDVSDGILDSLAILDNFRWNLTPAVVNTHQ